MQSEKLLCAECVVVPKLVAHKYSGFNVEQMNALPFGLGYLVVTVES